MSEHSAEKPDVLVVDDSRVIRFAAKKMFGDNYTVHLAADGLIGWAMLQQNSAISVAFTDLSMPNMNGIELLESIRGSNNDHIANMPVIIMIPEKYLTTIVDRLSLFMQYVNDQLEKETAESPVEKILQCDF